MPDNDENLVNEDDNTTNSGDDSGGSDDSGGGSTYDSDTSGGSSAPTINISVVNANTLDELSEPASGYSFILVDRASNAGVLLDYNALAEAILSKVMSTSDTLPDDGIKFYFME